MTAPKLRLGIFNPLLDTDSYKASHACQYPAGTEYVYSYIESRGGEYDKTVFFGLQMFLKDFGRIVKPQVDEAEMYWTAHGEPFDRSMWDYIVDSHGGRLPLEIRAVAEGTVIGTKNVLVTITNTDPKCAAAVSFFETALLRAVWYPTTVATNSYRCKQILKAAFDKSSDAPEGIRFKLHDFGARGVSSRESAGIGGCAHLVNFMGTDTMSGILYAKTYYDEPMAGLSIPAGEHSTVTTWRRDGEVNYLRNLINKFGKPGGLFACPIDSYDTWDFLENVLGKVMAELISSGATYVARPDSGDPLIVPVETVRRLADMYGYTINSKGYKVLPNHLRVIQGDGINVDTLPQIINNLLKAGFSIDNIAFGMGGGLLQMVNRDTFKFAMKCSAAKINGTWIDVYKDPIDMPEKKSKKGRFVLVKKPDGHYETYQATEFDIVSASDYLQPVWRNGFLLRNHSFTEVRANAGF